MSGTTVPPLRILVNAIPLIHVATGIGRYVRHLYETMERRHGDEVQCWYFDGRGASRTLPTPTADLAGWSRKVGALWKLPPHLGLAVRLGFHARREWAFQRALASQAFDVYHETAFFPFFCRLPTVFTVHDISLQRQPQWHPRERVLYSRCFFRRRLRRVREFLAVSSFTKRELVDWAGLPPERVTVTPLAHDPAVFHQPDEAAVAAIREKYQLPSRFFLFLGSSDPRKNAALIPQAAAAAGLDVPLVAVGWSGWDDAQQGMRSLGYVPDADLAPLYAAALALVYPSRYEGFGLPVLEAMACGCPVIATRAASLPEAGGEAALYLDDPDDAPALGRLLAGLAGDESLRQACIARGLAHAARFSWNATADATWDVLRRAAGRA